MMTDLTDEQRASREREGEGTRSAETLVGVALACSQAAEGELASAPDRLVRALASGLGCSLQVEFAEGDSLRKIAIERGPAERPATSFETALPLGASSAPSGSLRARWSSARSPSDAELGTLRVGAALLSGRIELLAAERRAQGAEEGRDGLLAMLSHELRTPLQSLTIGSELMVTRLRQSADGVPHKWLLERTEQVRKSVLRLRQLLDTFLNLAQLRSGRLTLHLEPFDLRELTQEVVRRNGDELSWAGCPCTLELPEAQVGTWDRMQLDLLLSNLLSNAMKYGGGHPIHVKLSGDAQRVQLTVADEGPGIAQEDQERLFQPYVRLPAATRLGGFGLGLWIVRQLAQAMGGEVGLQSALGRGAAFTVTLPRQPAGQG